MECQKTKNKQKLVRKWREKPSVSALVQAVTLTLYCAKKKRKKSVSRCLTILPWNLKTQVQTLQQENIKTLKWRKNKYQKLQCKKVIRLFILTKCLAKKASKSLVHNSSSTFYKLSASYWGSGTSRQFGPIERLCSRPPMGLSQTSDSMLSASSDWSDMDTMVPLMFLARRLKVFCSGLMRLRRALYRYWYCVCEPISDRQKTNKQKGDVRTKYCATTMIEFHSLNLQFDYKFNFQFCCMTAKCVKTGNKVWKRSLSQQLCPQCYCLCVKPSLNLMLNMRQPLYYEEFH